MPSVVGGAGVVGRCDCDRLVSLWASRLVVAGRGWAFLSDDDCVANSRNKTLQIPRWLASSLRQDPRRRREAKKHEKLCTLSQARESCQAPKNIFAGERSRWVPSARFALPRG